MDFTNYVKYKTTMNRQRRRRRVDRRKVENRGSKATRVLERAWNNLRKVDDRIPVAVIVLIDAPGRSKRRGHFAMSTWTYRGADRAHEVGVSPRLFMQPKEVLATMLHEAAHASLSEEGKNGGMGSTAYYHTKIFRDRCQEFGLECEFLNSRYGWTITRWPLRGGRDQIPRKYAPILTDIKHQLPAGVESQGILKIVSRKLPQSGRVRLSCCCDELRRIYVARSVAEFGGIFCEYCGQSFTDG